MRHFVKNRLAAFKHDWEGEAPAEPKRRETQLCGSRDFLVEWNLFR